MEYIKLSQAEIQNVLSFFRQALSDLENDEISAAKVAIKKAIEYASGFLFQNDRRIHE